MFFNLHRFEENFLKYIVGMIDYVGQHGPFLRVTNTNQEFLISQIDKRTESRIFYSREKNHSMVYSNVK